jgi:dTMP kinase
MDRGKLIVIEGCEGCGKTTQSKLLRDYLSSREYNCYLGREPGGVSSAEDMRKILKNPEYKISPTGELFGFCFARTEFYSEVVIPNLERGMVVVLDRSGWSTEAYQGYAGNVSLDMIREFNRIATQGVKPDLGIIIDINPERGLMNEIEKDRFSRKGLEYHMKVRHGFLKVASENENCFVIKYNEGDIESMQNEIRLYADKVLNAKSL